MKRVEVCETLCALVVRVDARLDARVATPPSTITEATAIPCQGAARRARRQLAVDETLKAQVHRPTCKVWRYQQEA